MSAHLRQLAATTAVALAFSPLANAAGLLGDTAAMNTYRPAFSIALRQAAADDLAGGRARGFMVELEKALADTIADPDTRKKLTDNGIEPSFAPGKQVSAMIDKEIPQMRAIAQLANIKLD